MSGPNDHKLAHTKKQKQIYSNESEHCCINCLKIRSNISQEKEGEKNFYRPGYFSESLLMISYELCQFSLSKYETRVVASKKYYVCGYC